MIHIRVTRFQTINKGNRCVEERYGYRVFDDVTGARVYLEETPALLEADIDTDTLYTVDYIIEILKTYDVELLKAIIHDRGFYLNGNFVKLKITYRRN